PAAPRPARQAARPPEPRLARLHEARLSAEPTPAARPAELVANFLSVISIVGSLLALVWDPLRLSPFAVLLALIAVGMAPRGARLPFLAVFVGALCFVAGLTIAISTNHPLY